MAKKWIAGAIKHPGALHEKLGVPKDQPIPKGKIEKATHSKNPTLSREANLAQTLSSFHPKSYADGGKLVKVHFCNGGKTAYADGGKVPTPPPPPPPKPTAGLAEKAADALKNRKSKLDAAIEAAGG